MNGCYKHMATITFRCAFLFPFCFFKSTSVFVYVMPNNSVLQRLDLSAITHDHGSDISKAVSLSLIHSILCYDHELDNSVNADIDSPAFNCVFVKAAGLAATLRGSHNLWTKLRDFQVWTSSFYSASMFPASRTPVGFSLISG
jgi:hypothetical protein